MSVEKCQFIVVGYDLGAKKGCWRRNGAAKRREIRWVERPNVWDLHLDFKEWMKLPQALMGLSRLGLTQ